MMLDRDGLIISMAYLRSYMPFMTNPRRDWGLIDGFFQRERVINGLKKNKSDWDFKNDPDNSIKNQMLLNDAITQFNPNPFWMGIHPSVAIKMTNRADHPNDSYWDTRFGPAPGKATLKVIPTEPDIDSNDLLAQIKFIQNMLPEGSLSIVFTSKGKTSIWNHVPVAGSFADNPHQMSFPLSGSPIIDGFNMLLLTSSHSQTVPQQWKDNGMFESLIQGMNVHQVGHCKIIPTCWEYIDRTYSLLTPRELLELTIARNSCLSVWFRHYGFDIEPNPDTYDGQYKPYIPDTASYLYEVKIIERAAMVSKLKKVSRTNELPPDIFWFRGFHLDEICNQLNLDREIIIGAINAMDAYWLEAYYSAPQDPVYNSAAFSTDIGTNPVEEICVDMLANASAGKLPEIHSYWQKWISLVDFYWNRWESSNMYR